MIETDQEAIEIRGRGDRDTEKRDRDIEMGWRRQCKKEIDVRDRDDGDRAMVQMIELER